jgi:hypothetical protein
MDWNEQQSQPESRPIDWAKVGTAGTLALGGLASLATADVVIPQHWAKMLLVLAGFASMIAAIQLLASSGIFATTPPSDAAF